jgi:beta-propeller repeat-containing protein
LATEIRRLLIKTHLRKSDMLKRMKTWIVLALLVLGIVGCATYKRRTIKVQSPPLPPGLKAPPVNPPVVRPKILRLDYLPSDFAVTSVRVQSGNVVLAWQNGTPPFQPQMKTDIFGTWSNYGASTMLRSITNPAPGGGKAFFRVQSGAAPASGSLVWLRNTPSNNAAVVNKLKVDRAGNVIAVGTFFGNVDFGGITLVNHGASDAFVAKYNAQDVLQWAKAFGGSQFEAGKSVAVDGQDNIIAIGEFFSSSVNFGGGAVTNQSAQNDVFVVKLTPSGSHVWSKGYGSLATDTATDVASDSSGSVFVTSKSGNTVNFGDGVSLVGFGGTDIAIAKFASANGTVQWAKLRGGGSHDSANAVYVDPSGNVLVAGDGGGDFGNGVIAPNGFFVANYSGADGAYRWHKAAGGGTGYGITTARLGTVIVTGACSGTSDFGGGPVSPGSPNPLFLVAYNSSGQFLWSQAFGGGSAPDRGLAIAFDLDDTLAVTGQVNNTVNFGGGPTFGFGVPSWFVAVFTTSGNSAPVWRWSRRAPTTSTGNGVAIDSLGHVLNGGAVTSTVDFGGTTVVGQGSVGAAFVVQYVK